MLTPSPVTPLSRAVDLAELTQAPAYIYAEDLPTVYAVADQVYHNVRMIVSGEASLPFRCVKTVHPRPRYVPTFE